MGADYPGQRSVDRNIHNLIRFDVRAPSGPECADQAYNQSEPEHQTVCAYWNRANVK